ncbi:FG-GAP repeat domain-containing protein, partial [Klebsiella aerogenes]|uniref:FG-GAP repeat domain-containing protein n=1 Tax=Klebsiella aerogenes TaxID=548 RepID=UPI001CC3DD7D
SATSPAFAASSTGLNLPKVQYFAKAALADIDADGDLDLFIGSGDGITYFYLNTGAASSAAFAGSTIGFGLTDVDTFAAPAFGDFDGDGDL